MTPLGWLGRKTSTQTKFIGACFVCTRRILPSVFSESLRKTYFDWHFISGKNILFWLTIFYKKPFVFFLPWHTIVAGYYGVWLSAAHSERHFLLGILFQMKIFCSDWPYFIRNHLPFYILPHDSGGVLWFHLGGLCVFIYHLSFCSSLFCFRMITSKHQWIFNKLCICALILWRSGLGLLRIWKISSNFDGSCLPKTCPYFGFRMITWVNIKGF